jgi:acetyl esterase
VTDVPGDYPSRVENAEGYFLDYATMEWFHAQYGGHLTEADLTDPRLSPLYGDLAGLAPAVVVTAEFDPLRDDGLAYAEALEAAGVPVTQRMFPGMIHGFADMGRHSPGAQAAIDETFALFRDVLHG